MGAIEDWRTENASGTKKTRYKSCKSAVRVNERKSIALQDIQNLYSIGAEIGNRSSIIVNGNKAFFWNAWKLFQAISRYDKSNSVKSKLIYLQCSYLIKVTGDATFDGLGDMQYRPTFQIHDHSLAS